MIMPDNTGNVRVGVVGPADVVHRMMDIGHALVLDGSAALSLEGASYQKLSQIPDRVRGLVDDVDSMLFAGPLPYDVAKDAGTLTRPATYVELSGSSLYGAMLRAVRSDEIDLERISIDSLSLEAINEAYDECEIASGKVQARPYDGPDSASGFADFHLKLFERGRTTGALTTVDSVASQLTRAGVPVVRVSPTWSALRTCLRTAAYLGAGSVLEGSQVVIGLIEIPDLRKNGRLAGSGSWAAEELRLDVVRALRPETDRLAMSLMPRDDRRLALVATLASLTEVTQQFTAAPFVSRIRRATGLTPYIGFGMGATAGVAEMNAELALVDARASPIARVYVRMRDGSSMSLGFDGDEVDERAQPVDTKHAEALETLQRGLADGDSDAQVVDAELASQLLGTSARTARRVLQDLARDGLAWPIPPASASAPGRPRQTYRLVARQAEPR